MKRHLNLKATENVSVSIRPGVTEENDLVLWYTMQTGTNHKFSQITHR